MSNLLKANLKMAHGGTAMRFAFVAQGSSGKLLVAKSVAPAQLSEAKKAAGGGQVFQGRCVGENGILFFEVDKEPPGNLLGQLKRCIKDDAEQTWPIEFRSGITGEVPPAPPPEAPTNDAAGLAAFNTRLKGLLGAVVKAVAAKSPASTAMRQTAADAQNSARNGDLTKANTLLDHLQQLLQTPAAPPAPAANGSDLANEFKAKLKQWTPAIKQAMAANGPQAGALAKMLADVMAQGKPGGNLAEAIAKLTACHQLATTAPPANAPPAQPDPFEEQYHGLLETVPGDVRRLRATDAATADKVQKIVDAGAALAGKGDFHKATEYLSRAAEALAKVLSAARAREAADAIPKGKVAAMKAALTQAQSKWAAALTVARDRLKPVQAAMQENFPRAVAGLTNILDGYEQELLVELQAGQAQAEESGLAAALATTRAKLQNLRAEIDGDDLFSYLQECGVPAKAAFGKAFDDVDALLQV